MKTKVKSNKNQRYVEKAVRKPKNRRKSEIKKTKYNLNKKKKIFHRMKMIEN